MEGLFIRCRAMCASTARVSSVSAVVQPCRRPAHIPPCFSHRPGLLASTPALPWPPGFNSRPPLGSRLQLPPSPGLPPSTPTLPWPPAFNSRPPLASRLQLPPPHQLLRLSTLLPHLLRHLRPRRNCNDSALVSPTTHPPLCRMSVRINN